MDKKINFAVEWMKSVQKKLLRYYHRQKTK